MKDPFEKERTEYQNKKNTTEDLDSLSHFLKPILLAIKGDIEPLIKQIKEEVKEEILNELKKP